MAAGGTPHTSPIPLVENGSFWGGVFGGSAILAIALAVAIILRKLSNRRRRRPDATTSAGEDRLHMQQRTPLMPSAKPGEF